MRDSLGEQKEKIKANRFGALFKPEPFGGKSEYLLGTYLRQSSHTSANLATEHYDVRVLLGAPGCKLIPS